MTRARDIMTALAVAGIGGLLAVFANGPRRQSSLRIRKIRTRSDDVPAGDGIPEEFDTVDTTPVGGTRTIYLDAELPTAGSVVDLSILEPPGEPEGSIAFDALDDGEPVVGDMFDAADVEAEPLDQGDRDDGESWVERLLVDSAMDLPAEAPLELDQEPLRSRP